MNLINRILRKKNLRISVVQKEQLETKPVVTDVIYLEKIGISASKEKHKFLIDNIKFCENLHKFCGFEFTLETDDAIFASFNNIKIQLHNGEELYILNEIYYEGCYNFLINSDCVVIDIGMNVGLASLFFLQKPFVKKILAFEPLPKTFEQARINIEQNSRDKERITIFNIGVGDNKNTVVVDFSNEWKGSTGIRGLPASKVNSSEKIEKVEIQLESIISVIDDALKYNLPIVAKIDCEGYEYKIFEKLENEDYINKISWYMIEWHDKGPEAIEKKLLSNNFKILSTLFKSNHAGMIYAVK
jgi:FkbM family methyltransferase